MKSIFFTFLFSLSLFIHVQNSTDADSLFSKSENLLYAKPSESAKIAQFLYENSQSENDKVRSLLLLTESNLIRGNLNLAVDKLFETWKISENAKNQTHRQKINHLLKQICMILEVDYAQLYLISKDDNEKKTVQYLLEENQNFEPYVSFKNALNLSSEENFKLSNETFMQLKPFDSKVENVWLKEEIYQFISENYKELGDWQQYRVYYNLQNALHDSLSLIKENARVLLLTKINQKQNEILASKSQNHSQILYGISGAIFLILIPVYLINSKLNSQKKKIENSIKQAEEKEKFEAEIKANESAGKIVIPDKTIVALLKKLEKFESKHEYLDASISLNSLAENLNTNTKYLSEIINTHKNKNFHSYINELRINYIIDKLKNNPVYLKYKVSHLAEEAGFSSHSLFSTVFKQVTGFSPATYTKLITKEELK